VITSNSQVGFASRNFLENSKFHFDAILIFKISLPPLAKGRGSKMFIDDLISHDPNQV
jgi:hypothetical protein